MKLGHSSSLNVRGLRTETFTCYGSILLLQRVEVRHIKSGIAADPSHLDALSTLKTATSGEFDKYMVELLFMNDQTRGLVCNYSASHFVPDQWAAATSSTALYMQFFL